MTSSPRFTRKAKATGGCPFAQTAANEWTVRDYKLAEKLISSRQPTRQWGFGAHNLERLPIWFRRPVLYAEGEEHRTMRSKTARFFSPRRTRDIHVQVIQDATDEAIDILQSRGRVDVSFLSMRVATRVAAHIVGLTSKKSSIEGLEERLIVIGRSQSPAPGSFTGLWPWIKQQYAQLMMYLRDVRPAIIERKKKKQDDLISHLISENYKGTEIMGEAVTYGTAGVITTRQFISACVWHLNQDRDLLEAFLKADDAQSDAIVYEILRLEPVVGKLIRQSTEAFTFEHEDEKIEIKERDQINFEIYDINADPQVMGDEPNKICPHRAQGSKRPPTFSFGSGHHRCPGEYVAILESRIFLKKLFSIKGLKIEGKPQLDYNDIVQGYEIEGIFVSI